MFSCELCEIFKNTFYAEHFRATASEGYNRAKTFLPELLVWNVNKNGFRCFI